MKTDPLSGTGPATAGGLLREARQRQGLHIAALAATVKVSTAKLEALEADRYDELPNLTFTRALAKTLSRVLKIDERAVLDLLPDAPVSRLDYGDTTLNMPFRERPSAADPAQWVPWRRPLPWLVLALLVMAAVFVLVPSRVDLSMPSSGVDASAVMPPPASAPDAAPAEGGAAAASPSPAAQVAGVSASGAAAGADAAASDAAAVPTLSRPDAPITVTEAASAPPSADGADLAVIRAVQDTWVQATDAAGQVLMARLLPAGETVELSGQLPLKLRIGNVAGTELQFRGKPVEIVSPKRDNVANLTLPVTP